MFRSPWLASLRIWGNCRALHRREHRPNRVPPPMPLPPRWRYSFPRSAQMKAVPVPMLTTTERSSRDR